MSKQRTITLSDRPPVTITEESWPVIASATEEEHDGQVRCQANQVSNWAIRVRQHADGRALVYATYVYTSNWQGDHEHKHGVLLPADTTTTELCAAIKSVALRMAAGEHDGDDGGEWTRLADECIADLPTEV